MVSRRAAIIAEQNKTIAALTAALEAVEWVEASATNLEKCHWCGVIRFKGDGPPRYPHAPDCIRQAALRKAGGEGE